MSGKHIELFLVDGTPGGLTTAEILNWTGQVFSAPRSEMSALVRRAELAGTCVYLLLGPDEQGGSRCYIGETDDFKARLRYHDANKEFWRKAVVITSKDANLTKAHGRYLESRLIALALQVGRVVLDNGTTPPPQALPEAHASDMDYFIDQLQIVLPALGVDAIRGRETVAVTAARQEQLVSPVFRLVNMKLGVAATAQQIDGEFTMLAGSTVVGDWQGVGKADSTIKAYDSYRTQHLKLIADGSIIVENGVGRVAKDIVFGSPSTAGAIAQGRSCNGRTSWAAEDGSTFGSWESRGVGTTEVS
ncbi:MAG: GIY-YIG nuclease family protein [Candidatus Nanopelagicales bacterium]|nr:GIY-YIG nuclease family protein [Candidatus Nanopelagicales bacterium]MDZ4249309.1 GIY-YIG nuclease family protein [Candidatus Nanopelagicales bacterium]